jgi:cobalt-zinc-cadmium efflux system membrane fusion protein
MIHTMRILIRSKIKITGFCLLLVFGALNFQACTNKSEKVDAERQQYIIPDSLLKTIRIDSVKQGLLINSITLTGQVDFNQDNVVNIFPLIGGNIQDIKVMLGDYVKEGQVLGVIKSSEMAQYSKDLLNAQTNLQLSVRNMEKTVEMYHSGMASQTDSISSAVGLEQAQAELKRVQRVLKINGGNTQGEYELKAPISGFIVQKFVTNDQVIRSDNGNALFTISDLKNVWVWANVYESNVGNIHMGDPVDVTTLSYPGKIFKGKVDKIMQTLDPASKAMKVRISIDNEDYALKPQMFASVTVTNNQNKQAIYIPTSGLIFDHSQYYVLVYKGEGKADIRQVQKLNTLGKQTYLTAGVSVGDRIITSDALQLYSELNN